MMRSRRMFIAGVAAISLAPLTGCGWAPLYADRAAGPADTELAAIKVAPIPERIGQSLALQLRQWLNPTGAAGPLALSVAHAAADLAARSRHSPRSASGPARGST